MAQGDLVSALTFFLQLELLPTFGNLHHIAGEQGPGIRVISM